MTTPVVTIAIYRMIQDGRLYTTLDASERCHTTRRHAQYVLKLFHECGLAHIAGWIRPPGGEGARNRMFIARWRAGPGQHRAKPARLSAAEVRRNRLRRLKDKYGTTIANKILLSRADGGTSVLSLEGEIVFRRGKPRGKYIRDKGAAA